MKISLFPALLSIVLTAVLSYLAHTIAADDENATLLVVGTAVSVLSTLGVSMGIKFANSKVGLNIKIWCFLFFLLLFAANLCFAWLGVKMPYYVILITTLWIIHMWVVWKMAGIKHV